MINFNALAGTQNGAHRSETFFEAELHVQRSGRVVFRTNDDKGFVAAGGDFLSETASQVDPVAFPAEFGPSLHGEHGTVVGLDHPGG